MIRLRTRTLLLYGLPLLVAVLWVGHIGWLIMPADTDEYLHHDVMRPPLYPLFLDLTRLLFRSHFARPTAILQTIVAGGAAIVLSQRLSVRWKLGDLAAIPYCILMVGIAQNGAFLSTEALGFAILLLEAAAIVEMLHDPTPRKLLWPFWWAAAGILLRSQFAFILPVLFAIYALMWLFRRPRPSATVLLAAFAILAGARLAHLGYNKVVNGRFAIGSSPGVQLLTMNLYVMAEPDLALFADPSEQRYMRAIYERAHAGRHLYSDKERGDSTLHHLYEQYVELCYGVIGTVWAEQFTPHGFVVSRGVENFAPDEMIAFDAFTSRVAFRLLKRTAPRYLSVVFKSWFQWSGLFGLFCLFVFAIGAMCVIRDDDRQWAAVCTIILLWATNCLIVCLVESIMPRYAFYTDFLLFATMVALMLSLGKGRSDQAIA